MDEQYVPTTDEVRSWYMETWSGPDGRRGLAFDRWLAKRDAEVAVKALLDAADLMEKYAMRDDVRLTEHVIVEAGAAEVLREYAGAYHEAVQP